MNTFISPGSPLLFDVEDHFKSSNYRHLPQFAGIWSTTDIVQMQVPEPSIAFNPLLGQRLLTSPQSTFDPYASNPAGLSYNLGLTPVNYSIDLTNLEGWLKFEYIYFVGERLFTPTYRVTSDECLLDKTIKITYWNNTSLLGGNQYPDADYTNYRPFIRVFGSLDKAPNQDNRTFTTDGVGLSRLCRAENQSQWRLSVGPHPQWVHAKLEYIFMHQNITVQKWGTDNEIPLVPTDEPYQQQQNVSEKYEMFLGSGRLIAQEQGLVSC